jgi:hypothetical protein
MNSGTDKDIQGEKTEAVKNIETYSTYSILALRSDGSACASSEYQKRFVFSYV